MPEIPKEMKINYKLINMTKSHQCDQLMKTITICKVISRGKILLLCYENHKTALP